MRTTLFKEMTPLAKREALLRLHGIMMSLPVAKAAAKGKGKGKGTKADRLAAMERKLTAELMGQWRETYSEALRDVALIMPEELSGEAVDIISQRLADALGPSFGSSPAMRELIHEHVERAYKYGKLAFGMTGGDLSLRDVKAVDTLTRHDCFWIGEHYGSHVGPRVSELAREALDQGLGRQALAGMLRQELGKVGPNGYTYWDVVASSALVRARSFGSISGMSDAGIAEYEILAMGDERMCPICGEMDGRTFSVAAAKATIDAAIGLTSPDAFKAAMPWHSTSPKMKSSAELMASGQAMPPFHGRCRCIIVMAEPGASTDAGEPPGPVEPEMSDATGPMAGVKKIQGEHTWQQDLAAVNPNYATGKKEWRENCQRCVVAYEARRRGYDVEAKQRIFGGADPLDVNWRSPFNAPQVIKCASSTGEKTGEKVREQMRALGDDARAVVYVAWESKGAHVFIAEQEGGETRFIDPQSNRTDVAYYFSRAKKTMTYIFRIDDLDFTDDVKKCCKERA